MILRTFRSRSYITTLTQEQFREGYRKAQLIDVREPQEFERGHILGARNIPVSQMKHRLVEMRKDKPVYLYCQDSSRSTRAAQLLHKHKYKNNKKHKGCIKDLTVTTIKLSYIVWDYASSRAPVADCAFL